MRLLVSDMAGRATMKAKIDEWGMAELAGEEFLLEVQSQSFNPKGEENCKFEGAQTLKGELLVPRKHLCFLARRKKRPGDIHQQG